MDAITDTDVTSFEHVQKAFEMMHDAAIPLQTVGHLRHAGLRCPQTQYAV